MTLLDPTSGIGYATGQRLPSTHMTTIATQQVRALDAVNGGSYALTSSLAITAGGGAITIAPTTTHSGVTNLSGTTNLSSLPVLTGSQTRDRYQPQIALLNTNWTFDSSEGHWFQSSVVSGGDLNISLSQLIDSSTLTAVAIKMDGDMNGTGHTNFPASMPILSLLRSNDTNAVTTIATHTMSAAADFSSTIANYDATWIYTFGSLAHSVDKSLSNNYILQITGESGANSVTGLTLVSIKCTFALGILAPG